MAMQNENASTLNLEEKSEVPGIDLEEDQESDTHAASQWQLMWWKFRKHRIAMAAGLVIISLYFVAIFCEFLAPYALDHREVEYAFAPPQRLHFISDDGIHLWPFVYGLHGIRHPETLRKFYIEDKSKKYSLRLFVRGESYYFWGLFKTDLHLFGVDKGGALFLLGTDHLGRDLLSRIIYGSRISLTIGLVGVALSFVFGLVIGVVSGYYGGWVDNVIQRGIEILRSFPSIPLWMALAASLPASWSPLQVYMGITVVLSFIGWTGLARQVRGKILSLREEDFATAALLAGASKWRIMTRHLLPSFMSHIIVSITLAVPGMILGETSLSFLGLGLRPPVTSWGVLLKEAQNVQAVAFQPWLLTPVIFVIITVLAFNFVGDGLRDAADPYSR
ncbi:MAG: ABC transporter permease [Candidatus Latescibacteria bacterium]|jgi:peptide/nickel transport system permease protein|nr:ABC transporter permease [Candidatus Latescibacterota bacterium]MBT5828781.1 ABC transporter permease [Candidatus Latescibacterota bacterium]